MDNRYWRNPGIRTSRKVRALLAACVAAAVAAPSIGAPPVRRAVSKPASRLLTISVHPSAVATRGEVSIAEVATIEGGDAGLRTRIAALDLADAPELGKTATLTHNLIVHRIQIAGIDAERYRIQGAETVTLSTRGYFVPETEIVAAAKQYLLTRLPWSAADLSIETTRGLRGPVEVSGGRDDIRFEANLRASRVALGNIRVDVTILSKGVKQAEVPVSFDVHLCQTVAVASRRIERDHPLTAEDLFFERRPVDNIAGFLTESESPVGKRTKRVILPLQVVTKGDIGDNEANAATVIRQRDAVKLVARAGSLVVTTTGEALQDGRTGQTIKVRNVDSKKVVTGRVVNRNEVQVLY
jgi:flagellar basal body P-ring formation protein FlgA